MRRTGSEKTGNLLPPHTVRGSWPTPPIIIIISDNRFGIQEPTIRKLRMPFSYKLSTAICEHPSVADLKALQEHAEGTNFTDATRQPLGHPPDITKTYIERLTQPLRLSHQRDIRQCYIYILFIKLLQGLNSIFF